MLVSRTGTYVSVDGELDNKSVDEEGKIDVSTDEEKPEEGKDEEKRHKAVSTLSDHLLLTGSWLKGLMLSAL